MILKRKEFKWTKNSIELRDHMMNCRNMTWESSRGKLTVLKDMDTNYIKNVIKKIERKEYDFLFDDSVKKTMKMELIYRQIFNHKKK
jgi:hypothetical protein|tara:strand:- start:1026 stop:1286 length:261 start_codon:yes stop_codon:yes gene_type:complete